MRKGKIELLAPAGSYEAMVAAVQNGADAIYLGGNAFGARAFATNFNNEQLIEAVHYCHLRNVSLYVTVNTLYKDHQIDDLLNYISFLYENHVDAFIIQDMGLFSLIKDHFPDIEIHMSTQTSIRNIEGVRYFENQNVDRVVLARENSIEEIENICQNTDIDIEVFIHGAICMSYSGQCLMSSMIAKRSGNRGECGQPCRLQYQLIKNNDIQKTDQHFLLSPKDLCSIEDIGKLIKMGVKSFKIEGRMKRPEYVGTVVRQYRLAIDSYINQTPFDTKKAVFEMKKMFNRGFTGGFLTNDKNFTSKDIPGNRGVEIGKIISYHKKKKRLKIKISQSLKQNDRIYFAQEDLTRTITKLYKNGLLIHQAQMGDLIEIELDKIVNLKQKVYKVIDIDQIQKMQKYLETEHISIPVTMKIKARINQPISMEISDGKQTCHVCSQVLVEEAKKTPLSKERIIEQFKKLGQTIYHLEMIELSFPENGTIPIKEINNLRRHAVKELDQARLGKKREKIEFKKKVKKKNKKQVQQKLAVKITSLNQLEKIDFHNIEQIFIPFNLIDQIEDKDYQKIIPFVPYLYDEKELRYFIQSEKSQRFDKIMVSDFGALHLLQDDKKIILNYNFNLCNNYAVDHFQFDFVFSHELNLKDIGSIKTDRKSYFIAYSQIINMNLKHCVISDFYFGYKKKNCQICKHNQFELIDRKNKHFPIMTDRYCHNYILHCHPIYHENLYKIDADYILLDFHHESSQKVYEIIQDYQNNILHNKPSHYKTKLQTISGYL